MVYYYFKCHRAWRHTRDVDILPSMSPCPIDFITSVPFGIFPLERKRESKIVEMNTMTQHLVCNTKSGVSGIMWHRGCLWFRPLQQWDLQSGHLEDGAVHLVRLPFLVQQAVGAAAQAAVQRGCRDGGIAGSVVGPSCAETRPHPSQNHRHRRSNVLLGWVPGCKKLGGAQALRPRRIR